MLSGNAPPEIFDRRRRRALRERAGRREASFLWPQIAEELTERLADVSRTFRDILIIGPMAAFGQHILAGRQANVTLAALSNTELLDDGGTVIEEDRLHFAPASFDLVICAGTLDSVNDLPGALVQIRRSLRPDGLFLGHFFGLGSLSTIRSVLADAQEDRAAPHFHPQIDLRSAADLLTRAGFALPVADLDVITLRYSDWRRLVSDIRDMGIGNAIAGPRSYFGRNSLLRIEEIWRSKSARDGKVEEKIVNLYLNGWAPSPDQPKPAKRGSATTSLASVLPAPSEKR